MVLRVASEYTSSSSSSDAMLAPLSTDSSLSSSCSTDNDLEHGSGGGYSSQEELSANTRQIISKFVPAHAGKFARRRSQCEQLSHRGSAVVTTGVEHDNDNGDLHASFSKGPRAAPMSASSANIYAPVSAPVPATFRRWSTLVGPATELPPPPPKTIQFTSSSSSESYISSPSKSNAAAKSILPSLSPMLLFLATTITIITILHQQHQSIQSLQSELSIANSHRTYLTQTNTHLLSQLSSRESSISQYTHTQAQLTRINKEMSVTVKGLREEKIVAMSELERLRGVEKRVGWSEGRWDRFVRGVGEWSFESVVAKYGNGPHQVELTLQLPNESQPSSVKIDMAPLHLMPHSIHTFLDQVDSGVWDYTNNEKVGSSSSSSSSAPSFDLHAGHVLMAHGASSVGSSGSSGVVRGLMFPEYNAGYPHDKYTIAFPSSTASSSEDNGDDDTTTVQGFYVNMQPNTVHHSPRIESSSTTASNGSSLDTSSSIEQYIEGESCFGKINDESSRQVIDRMDALTTLEGSGGRLMESVIILNAKIVGR